MHPDLERLAQLSELDLELERVAKEVAVARGWLGDAAAAVAEATRERDVLRAAIADNAAEDRAAQRKLDDYRAKKAGALRMLETGMGSPEAAERQMTQCDAIIDETETALLLLMERNDALRRDLEFAEQALAKATLARDEAERQAPGRIGVAEREHDRLAKRRDAVRSELPADLRGRYDTLRSGKKKNTVARIADGTCSACQMVVGVQQIADIKRGLIAPCRGCGRWLVPA